MHGPVFGIDDLLLYIGGPVIIVGASIALVVRNILKIKSTDKNLTLLKLDDHEGPK
jgi:hypothetical protein